MEREYYIIPDYAALKHLLQQKSVGTYQYRYKRFVMVLGSFPLKFPGSLILTQCVLF